MSIPNNFIKPEGRWSGVNRLHLPWMKENPLQESRTEAVVDFAAREKFVRFSYHWIYENERQEGLLLLSQKKDSTEVSAVWIDSWHNGDNYMALEGQTDDGRIELKGRYAVPDHPDWGWRIVVESSAETFRFVMYNVSPDGEETLAVESDYQRA
jgi:hypothetical protein